jgi:hypothetical protein
MRQFFKQIQPPNQGNGNLTGKRGLQPFNASFLYDGDVNELPRHSSARFTILQKMPAIFSSVKKNYIYKCFVINKIN